jgi:hypothetical protein
MVKHIVMWNVLGSTPDERGHNIERLRHAFEGLRGQVPGLLYLEIGVDVSRISYACDVVLTANSTRKRLSTPTSPIRPI